MAEKTPRTIFFLYPLFLIFALTFFSGLFLAVYYIPTFTQAFPSLERLNGQVPFGWFIQRLHGAGGSFFLVLLFISLLQDLYRGTYKIEARSFWVVGLFLFFMAILANFTGFLLPLSQSALWGTVTVLSSLSTLPWLGNFFVDLLRGGKEIGGNALIRFYSAHIGIAAVMALLLFARYRSLFANKEPKAQSFSFSTFFILMITLGLLLFAITFAPRLFSDPLSEMANPMLNPERISPPWHLLFLEEALKFLAGVYPIWSGMTFLLWVVLLFLLPFIDRKPEQNLLLRPMILALGSAFLTVLIYFSLLGTANARYGERVILSSGSLSPAEIRGAQVFSQKNCAYCHQVFGREGRREGPDMSVMKERKRSPDWIRRYIFNARLYQPGTTMPRYEVPLEDLEALSAYLLSLDPEKGKFKAFNRKEFMDFGSYLIKTE
jgi:ubiquinol-cytochrome c reductase cytochrome b subunit